MKTQTGNLRFILKRRVLHISGAVCESLETIDVCAPELHAKLSSGGLGENQYDVTDLVGVEVLPGSE